MAKKKIADESAGSDLQEENEKLKAELTDAAKEFSKLSKKLDAGKVNTATVATVDGKRYEIRAEFVWYFGKKLSAAEVVGDDEKMAKLVELNDASLRLLN
ncbi:MAG: hypothetical protein KA954_11435 [Chitinophagales bacterium]|nr:hypothetical protein [Chitinophagales bacterium]MBP9704635.1 hypothetical protein [Chitinophagales bacterium]